MQFQWEIFLAILDENNMPQVFYQSGHVFYPIGIQNIQSRNFNFFFKLFVDLENDCLDVLKDIQIPFGKAPGYFLLVRYTLYHYMYLFHC